MPDTAEVPAPSTGASGTWLFTDKDYYRNPNMIPDLAALQKNLDMTKDLGFMRSGMDVSKFTDLTIVEEAAKRIPLFEAHQVGWWEEPFATGALAVVHTCPASYGHA